LRTALKLPQTLFELAVAILQLFILAGQLPQLVLEPLDTQLRIGIIGLRETGGIKAQQHGEGRGAGHMNESE
jgi:hypothetical protein